MNPICHSILSGAQGSGLWVATLSSNLNEAGSGICVDSANDIYISATASGGLLTAKYDSSGFLQWQRLLAGTTSADIAVDSADNIYVTGTIDPGQISARLFIAKYNSSGSLQWQRVLSGRVGFYGLAIAVGSANDVYVSGYSYSYSSSDDAFLVKYNSTGTQQWALDVSNNLSQSAIGMATDSAGNVYVAGETVAQGGSIIVSWIAKFNSSGVVQWKREFGSDYEEANAIAIDSSDNVYITGSSNAPQGGSFFLAKYNSSGTLQWQRGITGDFRRGDAIAIDSSDNVYVAGYAGSGSINRWLIVKYNSSGTQQWQRVLSSPGSATPYGIAIDGLNNVYVTGSKSGDICIAKLDSQGSLTGSFGDFSLTASNLSSVTTTFPSGNSSLSDASASETSVAATLTETAATLSSSLYYRT